MTTLPLQLSRFKTFLKTRKKNPDWARVDEPDNILPSFMIMVIGLALSVASAFFAYAFMTGQIETALAKILIQMNGDYEQNYATLTAVLIVFIQLVIAFGTSLFRVPDGDDLVEMISDLDENHQERLVELENKIDERLGKIEREMDLLDDSPELNERMNSIAGGK